jgi:glutamate--cysteine ligase
VTGGASQALRDLDHVRQVVAETCFPAEPTAPVPGRVGLEAETFPVRVLADGTPAGRVLLDDLVQLLDLQAKAGGTLGLPDPASATLAPRYPLAGGGSLTFEPGGQLEHSTTTHPCAAAALAELDLVGDELVPALQRHGVLLAAAGSDVWLPDGEVPQQLRAPRYPAMAAYFELRGPYGAAMMRRSCALQINLDLGGPATVAERWLVANLVAPLATATFAASPGPGAVSTRALAWQRLDPTRTGFPRRLVDGSSADPVEQLADAALAADVLLLRCRAPAPWEPGRPGWSFADWLRDGHPRHGPPTDDDLRYHLSTLFFEVRPRGFMELRAIDALPARLRPVPVVLLAGLLEDPLARAAARELLEPQRGALPALARRAATGGLADPTLAALAAALWPLACEGARRLGGYLESRHVALAEEFLERLTLRRRCPADELRAALARGPAAALAWASGTSTAPMAQARLGGRGGSELPPHGTRNRAQITPTEMFSNT